MVIIELTDKDAQAFLLFRKYQEKIALLVENRVFDLLNGSAEIHFNKDGEIASIDMHAKVFRKASIDLQPVALVKKVVS